MNYTIKPYIHNEEEKFTTLFTEIHKFSIEDLNLAIEEIDNVFSGKYELSSINGDVVSSIEFDKDKAVITYYGEKISEEPTQGIYKMLTDYRDALNYYEANNSI
ncbi:hypothetical protein I2486_05450 [Cellulophaga sp. E16_2]|uniref:hypothetical protein n=1 Tax=Cellulophaga sp. E16_2 TaxID=2789297 RepID=UPI001A91801F|nr:hypothetical protein [Cellulophaga sp. E16_2]MBO0590848.1 hypothetical protein [Cellulophaga sp. E16_2]